MLEEWAEFYLTVGSAAAALIGLLFVVSTLLAGATNSRVQRGERLFMTPTVFGFTVVFVISTLAMAPHLSTQVEAIGLGLIALAGLVYSSLIAARMYNSPLEDPSDLWFYGAAPLVGYLCLAGVACSLGSEFEYAPHLLGALTVALVLLHIRNAWDLVTWIAPRVEEIRHSDDPVPASASNAAGEENTD